jgi:hypothetical protein
MICKQSLIHAADRCLAVGCHNRKRPRVVAVSCFMLLHITPRLYLGGEVERMHVFSLVDVTIDKFGLVLREGRDLVARRPYPNKDYLVACRKTGQRAIDGIFIETIDRTPSFTVVTRWAMDCDQVLTHKVNYKVIDTEFDAITDNMTFWYGTSESLGNWSSRWPVMDANTSPANSRPGMAALAQEQSGAIRMGEVDDILNCAGFLIQRTETFSLPTVEPDRLINSKINNRLPTLGNAFQSR